MEGARTLVLTRVPFLVRGLEQIKSCRAICPALTSVCHIIRPHRRSDVAAASKNNNARAVSRPVEDFENMLVQHSDAARRGRVADARRFIGPMNAVKCIPAISV